MLRRGELGATAGWSMLGEVVAQMGYATPEQVQRAISRQVPAATEAMTMAPMVAVLAACVAPGDAGW